LAPDLVESDHPKTLDGGAAERLTVTARHAPAIMERCSCFRLQNVERRDPYGDLEKPITDVRNMAAIVAQVMEDHGGLEAGDVTISAGSWEKFSFAVYHLQELVDGLHTQYFRDCEADTRPSAAL
jgi:hypothetical protein